MIHILYSPEINAPSAEGNNKAAYNKDILTAMLQELILLSVLDISDDRKSKSKSKNKCDHNIYFSHN